MNTMTLKLAAKASTALSAINSGRVLAICAETDPSMRDLGEMVEKSNVLFQQFRDANDGRLANLETRLNRHGLGDGDFDAGEFGQSSEDRELKNAFVQFVRSGDKSGVNAIKAAMTVDSDLDGGVLVAPQIATEIWKVMRDVSPIRQVARIVELGSDAYEEPQDQGNSAGADWVGEREARQNTSTPKLGALRIPSHELSAQPAVTQKLLDDASFDVERWLIDKLGEDFAIKEGNAFVAGNGVGKPRGYTTYPTSAVADATRAWGKLEHVITGAAGAFAATEPADVLVDVSLKLKPQYLTNARWMMSRATAAVVRKLKDANENYLWQPALQTGQPNMLLGYPVMFDEEVPAIASNSLSIWFGDFGRGYTIAQRKAIGTLRDPFTNKPYVNFYTVARVGGDVCDFHALKAVKFAAS